MALGRHSDAPIVRRLMAFGALAGFAVVFHHLLPAGTGHERRESSRTHRLAVRGSAGGECAASFYDSPQLTASGERFDPDAMTTAHRTLPLGSILQVSEPGSG